MTRLVLIGLICAGTVNARAGEPVPVAELRQRGVLGELGEPLGKIVTVTGVTVDGGTLGRKDAAGNVYLRVSRVGDKNLAAPVLVRISQKLPFNKTVRVIGFETGQYAGVVEHEFDYVPAYAAVGYSFQTHFVVLKIAG